MNFNAAIKGLSGGEYGEKVGPVKSGRINYSYSFCGATKKNIKEKLERMRTVHAVENKKRDAARLKYRAENQQKVYDHFKKTKLRYIYRKLFPEELLNDIRMDDISFCGVNLVWKTGELIIDENELGIYQSEHDKHKFVEKTEFGDYIVSFMFNEYSSPKTWTLTGWFRLNEEALEQNAPEEEEENVKDVRNKNPYISNSAYIAFIDKVIESQRTAKKTEKRQVPTYNQILQHLNKVIFQFEYGQELKDSEAIEIIGLADKIKAAITDYVMSDSQVKDFLEEEDLLPVQRLELYIPICAEACESTRPKHVPLPDDTPDE